MRIMLKNVRLSFPALFSPKAIGDNDNAKYGATLLIDKSDKENLKKIHQAVEAAVEEGKTKKFEGKVPRKWRNEPLRDGDDEKDTEKYPEFEGTYFITARSNNAPQVVDNQVEPILDQSEVYSGCYVNVTVSSFPYNFEGTKGISWGLGNVQKVKDGEPLGGGGEKAENEFEAFESEDDGDDLL